MSIEKLEVVDVFKDNEYKIYSTRKRRLDEIKVPQDALLPINVKLEKTISTSLDAAKHVAEKSADPKMQRHISDALDNNEALKKIKQKMPSKTPKALTDYQQKYSDVDKIKANDEINKIGVFLPDGQELYHGGNLTGVEDNSLITNNPLSTTFDPQVALRNAEHNGKAYDEGQININVIKVKDPKTKAFVYKQKGTKFGHEKEVLFASKAKIKIIKQHIISTERKAYKASKEIAGKILEKIVPVYVTEIELS